MVSTTVAFPLSAFKTTTHWSTCRALSASLSFPVRFRCGGFTTLSSLPTSPRTSSASGSVSSLIATSTPQRISFTRLYLEPQQNLRPWRAAPSPWLCPMEPNSNLSVLLKPPNTAFLSFFLSSLIFQISPITYQRLFSQPFQHGPPKFY